MITVSLYDRKLTAPTKIADLSDVCDSIRFSTQLHGGFGSCTIRIGGVMWKSYTFLDDLLLSRVILRHKGTVLWDGRIAIVDIEPGQITLQCEGWFAHGNDIFLDLQYPSSTPVDIDDVVSDCIDASTRWNSSKEFIQSTNLQQVNVEDVDYMDDWHLNTVIEDVCKYGTDNAKPVYFAIWEDRKCHLFEHPTYTPSVIKWHLHAYDLAGGQQGIATSRDATKFGNIIAVIYSSSVGARSITANTSDSESIAAYGNIYKRMSISGAAQFTAEAIRDLAIAENSFPPQSVNALVDPIIWNTNMSPEPIMYVRAGDTVRLHLDPRLIGSVSYDNSRTLFVMATEYDVGSGRMRLELDTNPSALDVILSWFGLSGGRLI